MERAVLVTVDHGERGGWSPEDRSSELSRLAVSAGAKVSRELIVKRRDHNPAYYIGVGKAEEIRLLCAKVRADIVIFNHDLSAAQQKNLEEVVRSRVIDRTQLILDIFARRAHSNEGKVQVELAQLMYLLPRLTGKGVELSRLGGGIGTRGPGEQKLEVDRRRIRDRIARLKEDLEDLSRRRAMMRKKRERFSALTAALVGYTNVGKSTLINALTQSRVIVQDRLFSTLDPTIRRFVLPNKQKILFVDTVGFLNDLPHHLIEAFKATLEEVSEADILLHLVDVSHPKAKEQSQAVYEVLEEIGARDKPIITVLNKIDKVSEPGTIDRIASEYTSVVNVSAVKRLGFDDLIAALLQFTRQMTAKISILIPPGEQGLLGVIHENGLVTKTEYRDAGVYIEAEIPIRVKEFLEKRLDN